MGLVPRRGARYTIDGGRFTIDGGDLLVAEPPNDSAPDGWGFDYAQWRGVRAVCAPPPWQAA